MGKFQIILLGLFVVFMAAGLLIFSAYKGKQQSTLPPVTIWGTIDQTVATSFFQGTVYKMNNKFKVTYVQKRPETMYQQYIEALIAGQGPDILLLPQDELLKYQSKIAPIPYTSFTENDFKNIFIQEGELYLTDKGINAIPFTVDPMVMFWNRDLFSNALISTPPKYWQDVVAVTQKVTQKDVAANIIRSGVGLGEFRNVVHAKEMLSVLMMQAGTPITARDGTRVNSYISSVDSKQSPAEVSLNFFTQFSDPSKLAYSWNRSLPASKTFFTANKLGLYFGYGSEYRDIRALNPNLNFDVALMPQIRPVGNSLPVNITYGKMYGLSISRGSKVADTALQLMFYLIDKNVLSAWVKQSGLSSVRRDALAVDASESSSAVFATSALWSRGWLDPDAIKSNAIFQDMVEGVTSGRVSSGDAINNANSQLQNLLNP